MLSTFTSFSPSSIEPNAIATQNAIAPNLVKRLSHTTTTWSYFKKLLTSPLNSVRIRVQKRDSN